MRYLNRILPFLVCFILVVSMAAAFSLAYAAEVDQPLTTENGDNAEESDAPVGIGMQETTAQLGKALMNGIWSLFGIDVPGFSFTFGQMWVGVFLASVSILVIRMFFGFGGGSRGDSPRTSSTNHPRISKERRHDEF